MNGKRRQPAGSALGRSGACALAGCCLLAAAGCGSDVPDMVSVSGQVTLDGGPWPKPGVVNFTPAEPAPGFPRKSGSGHFDTDGYFTAMTGDYEGLIPGEYRISVTCWERPPGDNDPGKSFTAAAFASPFRSGLELTIEPDGAAVTWDQDVPRAR